MGVILNNGMGANDNMAGKNEIVKFSIIHFINSNIKLFYVYNANFKCFNFFEKNAPIVYNMDYL
jgi:hypothetical protein